MNTLKTIGLVLLYTIFMNACTVDNTVEAHLNSKKIDIIGSGGDGTAGVNVVKS